MSYWVDTRIESKSSGHTRENEKKSGFLSDCFTFYGAGVSGVGLGAAGVGVIGGVTGAVAGCSAAGCTPVSGTSSFSGLSFWASSQRAERV